MTVDTGDRFATLLSTLCLIDEGDGRLTSRPAGGAYPTLFGGIVIGQAVNAACANAPAGRRIHSFHGTFLRPLTATEPVVWQVDTVRDGASFSSRRVSATQRQKEAFTGVASFCADTEGYEYEIPPAVGIPPVDSLAPPPDGDADFEERVAPAVRADDGTYLATRRAWMRTPPVSDDPGLHATVIGFMSDITGTSGRPLRLDGTIEGMVSLDHALWFHRPIRPDQWLFYDVLPVINAGGRGLLRGSMYGHDGRLAATVTQEMLVRFPS